MKKEEAESGNFIKGIIWATIFSIPLWLSVIGWAKLLTHFLHTFL